MEIVPVSFTDTVHLSSPILMSYLSHNNFHMHMVSLADLSVFQHYHSIKGLSHIVQEISIFLTVQYCFEYFWFFTFQCRFQNQYQTQKPGMRYICDRYCWIHRHAISFWVKNIFHWINLNKYFYRTVYTHTHTQTQAHKHTPLNSPS